MKFVSHSQSYRDTLCVLSANDIYKTTADTMVKQESWRRKKHLANNEINALCDNLAMPISQPYRKTEV